MEEEKNKDENQKLKEQKEPIEVKQDKQKSNKVFVIVIVVIAMALTFGCGIILGQKLFEGNKENKNTSKDNNTNNVVDNNQGNGKNNFIEITKDLINGTSTDNISIKYVDDDTPFRPYNVWINELTINGKKVSDDLGTFYEITKIYKISDNYLVIIEKNQDIRSTYYYLYDKQGNVLQNVYELDDNDMVINSGEEDLNPIFNGNIIEVYGTRLTHGPSLEKNNKSYEICDKNEISKANVDDDYVVEAKYQLIYNSNKFEIKKIDETEKTLGEYKNTCGNNQDIYSNPDNILKVEIANKISNIGFTDDLAKYDVKKDLISVYGNFWFTSNKFSVNDLSKLQLITTAIRNIDLSKADTIEGAYLGHYSLEEINDALNKVIYGKTITLDDIKNTNGKLYESLEVDGNEIIVKYPYEKEWWEGLFTVSYIDKISTENNKVNVFLKVAFCDYENFQDINKQSISKCYKDSNKKELIDKLSDTGYDEEKTWNKYNTYKVTFKLVNGEYYFDSYELVK